MNAIHAKSDLMKPPVERNQAQPTNGHGYFCNITSSSDEGERASPGAIGLLAGGGNRRQAMRVRLGPQMQELADTRCRSINQTRNNNTKDIGCFGWNELLVVGPEK